MSCSTGWTVLKTAAPAWVTIDAYTASCPDIVLTGTDVADGAAAGTIVGVFSMLFGFGTYTYTLTNPGAGAYFEIVGNYLQVISPPSNVANPTVTITVTADNGLAADVVTESFVITVLPSGSLPSYDFSDPNNSMYL